jgi:peptidoglycan/LPS O-acetylase OafA/YrhL
MAMGATGVGVIIVAAFVVKSAGFPGLIATVPVAGAALAIVGGTVADAGVSRLLGTRPFTEIGDMSYSWYLWHWPLIVLTPVLQ